MERKKLEASIKQLSETVRFNETDLEEKFVQQEKEYVLRSNQTQREINSKSNKCVNAFRSFQLMARHDVFCNECQALKIVRQQ